MDNKSATVVICNWCQDPANPSRYHHPDGGPCHVVNPGSGLIDRERMRQDDAATVDMLSEPTEGETTMLVLSRKLGEKILIGDGPGQIAVTVVDIDRGKIRLGIEAPRTVPILRAELATHPSVPAPNPDADPKRNAAPDTADRG